MAAEDNIAVTGKQGPFSVGQAPVPLPLVHFSFIDEQGSLAVEQVIAEFTFIPLPPHGEDALTFSLIVLPLSLISAVYGVQAPVTVELVVGPLPFVNLDAVDGQGSL